MKIYKLTEQAIKDYRKGARRDKDISKEVLELKISALINNSTIKNVGNGTIYTFGAFRMVYSIIGDNISLVYWNRENYSLTEETVKNLENDYLTLGLNKEGNKFFNN